MKQMTLEDAAREKAARMFAAEDTANTRRAFIAGAQWGYARAQEEQLSIPVLPQEQEDNR